jgi:putative tryptophan/tyrosine transport system substrate-binding protein
VSYGADPVNQYRLTASYVDQILRGARRSASSACDKFQLAVNLKTAKALGLTISPDFLLVVDEVIE